MRYLLDTHLILWSAHEPERLSRQAREILTDSSSVLAFSAANIWEIVIKRALERRDFHADPALVRLNLLDLGYEELAVTSIHTLALIDLPRLHRDPIDRLLIAQAITENMTLVTADRQVARYPGPILKV